MTFDETRLARNVPWVAGGLGMALFIFHLIVNRQYGFHGDELYFIVCGSRPAWGYVDHPPFIPMVARVATALMGVNLFALRFFPALVLGISCVLTGWLARRLGAGTFGEFLACLSFVFAPLFVRLGAFLNIPSFEVLFWLLAAHLIVTIAHREEPRWWLAIGALMGLALLNKHTTLFLGTGLAVGLVLTPRRKDLATPWPWLAAALAFLIFLPNLIWQYHHHWATLEFVRNLNATVMQTTPRAEFIMAQFLLMNLFNAVVWIGGLVFFLKTQAGRPYRMLGWAFLTVLVIMLVFKAKVYYLVPAYPMLLAAGGVLLERKLTGRVARVALTTAIAAMGILFIPIVSPVGTLEWKEAYITRVLGFIVGDPINLTFDFRYETARQEEVQAFQGVYNSLPADEQKTCVILASDYGTTSNVNVMGSELQLPPAIGGNNSYYLWGPKGATGQCLLATGYEEELLRQCFNEVTPAAQAPTPWLGSKTPARPIYICRKPVETIEKLWANFKLYR